MNSTPPASSRTPTIGLYYSASMIATTFVMFICGYLIEMHFRSDRRGPMPENLRKFVIRILAAWLFIPIPETTPLEVKKRYKQAKGELDEVRKLLRRHKVIPSRDNKSFISEPVTPPPSAVLIRRLRVVLEGQGAKTVLTPTPSPFKHAFSRKTSIKSTPSRMSASQSTESLQVEDTLSDLIQLRLSLQRTAYDQVYREYEDLIQTEWMIASMVFDRIFFLSYISWIILSLWMLLPQGERFD